MSTRVHTVTHRTQTQGIDIIGNTKITLLKLNALPIQLSRSPALPILLCTAHLEVSSTSSISIVSKSGRKKPCLGFFCASVIHYKVTIGEQMLNPVFILPLIKANWVFCRSWFLDATLPLLESPVNSHQTSIRILYQMLCSWNVYVVQGNMTQPLHWKYKRKGELSFIASLSNIR